MQSILNKTLPKFLQYSLLAILIINFISCSSNESKNQVTEKAPKIETDNYWRPQTLLKVRDTVERKKLEYGKELIAHTAKYLGPNGSVFNISNGLNCQNCHLDAGTKIYGNNYGSVAANYPKLRGRSGKKENIYKRVNDCFVRSLNGSPLDTSSYEMEAIVAYINFLGSNVPKGLKAKGSGFKDIELLNRAADPTAGLAVYTAKCQSCHQANGEGVINGDKTEYIYPPLWGNNSYNNAAGLYRISNFAKYVLYNMPLGSTHKTYQLTAAEAWDVAAYVNSQPRPSFNIEKDWPDIAKKPMDHPFGPFADSFSEEQHKYGPYQPIIAFYKKEN